MKLIGAACALLTGLVSFLVLIGAQMKLIGAACALLMGLVSFLVLSLLKDAYAQSNLPTTVLTVSIGSANTFQAITGLPTPRRSLTIQNNNVNGDNCWLFIGSGTATKGTSILLGQGQSYGRYTPYIPVDTLQVTCATNGDSVYVEAN
jgi:hypothetical protein